MAAVPERLKRHFAGFSFNFRIRLQVSVVDDDSGSDTGLGNLTVVSENRLSPNFETEAIARCRLYSVSFGVAQVGQCMCVETQHIQTTATWGGANSSPSPLTVGAPS